jgi:hypothetical protein
LIQLNQIHIDERDYYIYENNYEFFIHIIIGEKVIVGRGLSIDEAIENVNDIGLRNMLLDRWS